MVAVGAAWGVLQLSVVARIVALVWNRSGRGVPFRPLHRLLALAMAPQVLALGCWTIGILVVGPSLYLDPEFAIIATPASGVLSGLVAVTTLVAWIWSAVLVGTAIAFLHPTRGLLAGLGSVALFAATAMGFFRLSPFLFQ